MSAAIYMLHMPRSTASQESSLTVAPCYDVITDRGRYYDTDSNELYLAYNGTGAPPSEGWVVPQLKELIRIEGASKCTPGPPTCVRVVTELCTML